MAIMRGVRVKHRPLVFLDIETTGLSAREGRITEIGALRVENHKVTATFKQLINPEVAIPPFITRLTGITNEMLWESPTFRTIADELDVFLDGALFVAHNVGFDYSFIKAEFEKVGNKNFAMDRACTAKLSRRLYPEHRSHALDRIIERMNLDVVNRHRAYDDAEVLWKFFQAEYAKRDLELFLHVNKLTTYARTAA